MYANCLLFALWYRFTHRGTRIRAHWGTWMGFPHFYVEDGWRVVDFKSEPYRNCTPLLFRGQQRVRSRASFERLPGIPSPWTPLRYHVRGWLRYHRLLDRLNYQISYHVFMREWSIAGNACARQRRVKRLFNPARYVK